jgi:hypothetical protein
MSKRYEAKYELCVTFQSESMDDAEEYAEELPLPFDGEYKVEDMTLVHVIDLE